MITAHPSDKKASLRSATFAMRYDAVSHAGRATKGGDAGNGSARRPAAGRDADAGAAGRDRTQSRHQKREGSAEASGSQAKEGDGMTDQQLYLRSEEQTSELQSLRH